MNILSYYHYGTANPLLFLLILIVLIAVIPAWPYSSGWGYSPVGLVLLLLILIFLLGCTTTSTTSTAPTMSVVNNAATRTGQNLVGALSEVMQDYADVKKDGVSSLWSISKGLNAYHTVVKTTADVKQLIVDWKATKGDGNFLERLDEVLSNADVPAQTKALATAKAAESVAINKGP